MSRYARGIFFALEDDSANKVGPQDNNQSETVINYSDELLAVESLQLEYTIAAYESYAKSLHSLECLHDKIQECRNKGIMLDATSAQIMHISAEAICNQLNLPSNEIIVGLEHYENKKTHELATNISLEGIGAVLKKALTASFGLILKILAGVIIFVLAAIAFFKRKSGGSPKSESISALPNNAVPAMKSINSKQLDQAIKENNEAIKENNEAPRLPKVKHTPQTVTEKDIQEVLSEQVEQSNENKVEQNNENTVKNAVARHYKFIVGVGKTEAIRKLFLSFEQEIRYSDDEYLKIKIEQLQHWAAAPNHFMHLNFNEVLNDLTDKKPLEHYKTCFSSFLALEINETAIRDKENARLTYDRFNDILEECTSSGPISRLTRTAEDIANKLTEFEDKNDVIPKLRKATSYDKQNNLIKIKSLMVSELGEKWSIDQASRRELEIDLWPPSSLKEIDKNIKDLGVKGPVYLKQLESKVETLSSIIEQLKNETSTVVDKLDKDALFLYEYIKGMSQEERNDERYKCIDWLHSQLNFALDHIFSPSRGLNTYYHRAANQVTTIITYATKLIAETYNTFQPYLDIAREVYVQHDKEETATDADWKKIASELMVWGETGWEPFKNSTPKQITKTEAINIIDEPISHRYKVLTPFTYGKIKQKESNIDSYGAIFLFFTGSDGGFSGLYTNTADIDGPAVLYAIHRTPH